MSEPITPEWLAECGFVEDNNGLAGRIAVEGRRGKVEVRVSVFFREDGTCYGFAIASGPEHREVWTPLPDERNTRADLRHLWLALTGEPLDPAPKDECGVLLDWLEDGNAPPGMDRAAATLRVMLDDKPTKCQNCNGSGKVPIYVDYRQDAICGDARCSVCLGQGRLFRGAPAFGRGNVYGSPDIPAYGRNGPGT